MTTFGFDPVGEGVQRILLALSQGTGLPSRAEYKHVDLKEEAGEARPERSKSTRHPNQREPRSDSLQNVRAWPTQTVRALWSSGLRTTAP